MHTATKAVDMKVAGAPKERGDSRDRPQTPWPLVQPPPNTAPKPPSSPAAIIKGRFDETVWIGATPVTVQCGDDYEDAGATALDDVDGNITHRIVETITFGGNVVGSVNTSVLGTYTITYEVSDNAGQVAPPVARTVDVVDTTAPVITLNGASALLLECGAAYTEAGASATDGCDGDLEVTILGTVFSGALIMEVVFGYPGIGLLALQAVYRNDYSLMMGIAIYSIVGVATAVFVMDLVYPLFDPRVRYE